MKCSDLQIGDYVRFKHTKEIVWVFEIDGDRNVINNEPDGYCSEKNIIIDDVVPIPLTSEILERNGFTHCLTAPCGYYHAPAYDMFKILFHISEDTYEDT